MRQVVSPYYTPTGNQVTVIDAHALQTELNNLEQADALATSRFTEIDKAIGELRQVRGEIADLRAQVDATQLFYGYVAAHHPSIIDEYRIREAAKLKVCPPPRLVDADMQELELRTLAAIGKLP